MRNFEDLYEKAYSLGIFCIPIGFLIWGALSSIHSKAPKSSSEDSSASSTKEEETYGTVEKVANIFTLALILTALGISFYLTRTLSPERSPATNPAQARVAVVIATQIAGRTLEEKWASDESKPHQSESMSDSESKHGDRVLNQTLNKVPNKISIEMAEIRSPLLTSGV